MMAWKADLMPLFPAMGDERINEPAVLRGHVAIEEGPDMIAADRRAAFDQPDTNIRPLSREGKRDQAAGQAAAKDRQIAVQPVRHRSLLGEGT